MHLGLAPTPTPTLTRQVEEEDEEFEEEFVGSVDPSILHFLLASGDRISSKQARDVDVCSLAQTTVSGVFCSEDGVSASAPAEHRCMFWTHLRGLAGMTVIGVIG